MSTDFSPELATALRNEPVSPPEAAQERAIAAVSAAFARNESAATPHRFWVPTALVLIALAVGLTPQGRALAEDVGQLVGIGDEPTADRPDDGPAATDGAVVIGAGSTPAGDPFEIVAFQGRYPAKIESSEGQGTCIGLDFPELDDPSLGTRCIEGPQGEPLPSPAITDSAPTLGEEAGLTISGLIGPGIDRVEVTYDGDDGERVAAPTTVGLLTAELAASVQAAEEVGFFVSFLPDSGGLASPILGTVVV
ncbi:MAG: hypothetical protein M3331_02040, partial [Actinomycetota bacterium]|nr:hypothetical protein [Actinomycetota bacterium]